MVRATYQTRLSAIILGIRPTVAHVYGTAGRTPADNLSQLGMEAWSMSLRQLSSDLSSAPTLSSGERWMQTWIVDELERDVRRWGDASTILELLAVSLGPATPDADEGPRGRLFWNQWQRNFVHHRQRVESGAAVASHDTQDLVDHVIRLVVDHDGPQALLDDLALFGCELGPPGPPSPFRPLSSTIERLQLSAILGSAYDDEPVCTAAMSRLLEQRAPSLPCHAEANRRHMVRGWRYGSAAPGR